MQLFRGCIRKAENHPVEVLVELLLVVENGQVVALLGGRRRKVKVAFALENRAGHLAVHRRIKGDAALAQREGGRVAAQLQIVDRDHITARQQTTQLLVVGVGVGWALGEQSCAATHEKKA